MTGDARTQNSNPAATLAVATSGPLLVLARGLEGHGGAASLACGLGLVGHVFPSGAARVRATVLLAAPAVAQDTKVSRNGSQDSFLGPAEYFTGTAIIDRLFNPNDVRNMSAGHVTFAPNARSNGHTHPVGQTLIVTSGTGWIR